MLGAFREDVMKNSIRALALSIAAACLAVGPANAKEPYKVFLSMSYIGNDWQAEAANMLSALAKSANYADRVVLKTQVAGPNAQKQIQQINAMVQAGADAIIVYPISPTALNGAVKNACDKGVKVIAYDGVIEEPCAYNVHVDQAEWGRVTAEWLAKEIGGKGNVVMITGVPGTSVDTLRNDEARKVFAQYPDIKIVAEANGMWSQAVARTEMSKIAATHPWDQINGLWMQVGCYTAASMQSESGIADDKILPCAGEGSNGHRIQMLPVGTDVPGANGTYRPMGMRSVSASSQAYPGAMALKMIVDALDSNDVPKTVLLSPGAITSDMVKVCAEGTWEEMKAGCNAFQPAIIPNPGWFASIYSPDLPQVGLNAALTGSPEN
jgi:ribose transport system substrate-binding protein